MESMSFEEMELAVAFKAKGEACNIVGDSQLEYNNLKAQYNSAINESERVGVLLAMKNLLHNAIFQNLAANALKSYGTFTDESTGLAMCLLDYRKLFTVNQARVQAIQIGLTGLLLVLPSQEFKMTPRSVPKFLRMLNYVQMILIKLLLLKPVPKLLILLTEHHLEV